jgi:hypothetical protein
MDVTDPSNGQEAFINAVLSIMARSQHSDGELSDHNRFSNRLGT